MTGQRISDMDPITFADLPTSAAYAPLAIAGVNYKYDITETLNQQELTFERYGGGPDATVAANNAAWLIMIALVDAGEAGVIQLLDGTYQISTALVTATFVRFLTIQGRGPNRSIIKQTDANQNGFTFPSGLNHSVMFRDFSLIGAGSNTTYSGTGKGFYQPGGGGNDSYSIHFDNIIVSNFGSTGIEMGNSFSTDYARVRINYCGGGFVGDGNTNVLTSCYVQNLPDTGAVAYKFTSGRVTLISCNGVDDCDIWGRFGQSTVDGDATDTFCKVTLIGCNAEAFGTIGVDLRNGTLNSIATMYTGKANTSGLIALRMRSTDETGFLDNANVFNAGSGSTWSQSRAVHVLGTNAPFSFIAGGSSGTLTYWSVDAGPAADNTMPILKTVSSAVNAFGYEILDLSVPGRMTTLTEYRVNGVKVVGARNTGWTAGTGTPSEGAFAAYAGATMSVGYVQAEAQATNDAAKAASQRLLAIEQALTTHGLIGP